MTTTFDALPDDARLWVFTLSRPLTPDQASALVAGMHPFIDAWASHGRPVHAALTVAERSFVVVAAQIPGGDVSGCGIDALVRHLESTLSTLGVPLASGMDVAFRAPDGCVHVVDRPTFKLTVHQGSADARTPVFDATITSLGAWRAGAFEQPLSQTWMARYLPLPTG